MDGMLGFLENSSGLLFPETIDAFDEIGACETVSVLRAIEKTLDKHGITPARLRADFAATKPYEITTFRELHGDLGPMPNEVEQDVSGYTCMESPARASQFGPYSKRSSKETGLNVSPRLRVSQRSSGKPATEAGRGRPRRFPDFNVLASGPASLAVAFG